MSPNRCPETARIAHTQASETIAFADSGSNRQSRLTAPFVRWIAARDNTIHAFAWLHANYPQASNDERAADAAAYAASGIAYEQAKPTPEEYAIEAAALAAVLAEGAKQAKKIDTGLLLFLVAASVAGFVYENTPTGVFFAILAAFKIGSNAAK